MLVHTAGTRLTHRLGTIEEMELGPPFVVVSATHPSLEDAIHRFCDQLRAETRYFGRRGAEAPKPTPSLVRRLASRTPAIELAAFADGDIIGVARIDEEVHDGPELLLAVARPWRGRGVAMALGREVVARAHQAGMGRIVLRTTYRGRDLRDLGAALGFEVFDLGRGRLDLVRTLEPASRSA